MFFVYTVLALLSLGFVIRRVPEARGLSPKDVQQELSRTRDGASAQVVFATRARTGPAVDEPCIDEAVDDPPGGGNKSLRNVLGHWLHELSTGRQDHSGLGASAGEHLPQARRRIPRGAYGGDPAHLRPLGAPVHPEARGHGVTEVTYAVSLLGGRIAQKVALVVTADPE